MYRKCSMKRALQGVIFAGVISLGYLWWNSLYARTEHPKNRIFAPIGTMISPIETPSRAPPSLDDRGTKAVLWSYRRGGSSFVGEMFNQDPDVFYMYEPIDSLFSSLYGTSYGMHPIDTVFFRTEDKRILPDFESDTIARALVDILNCNLRDLPPEVLTHNFMHNVQLPGLKNFTLCVEYYTRSFGGENTINALLDGKYLWYKKRYIDAMYGLSTECKKFLRRKCLDSFDRSNLYKCHKSINLYENSAESIAGNETAIKLANVFLDHNLCLKACNLTIQGCLTDLIAKCKASKAKSIKVIRLQPKVIKTMLKLDPKIKFVHLFRDPRGIVQSRKNINDFSYASAQNDVKEARLLCSQMHEDDDEREILEKKYSKTFQVMKYEHFADDPLSRYKELAKFLGMNVSNTVLSWYKKKRDKVNTLGKSQIAYYWKETMDKYKANSMGKACFGTLTDQAYEL